MKWKRILSKKRNETLILFSVLLMISMIATMHKKHLLDLEETVTSIYEDRLVAEDYIFDLSKMMNSKKVALNNDNELVEKIALANHSVDELIYDYERTKLTEKEIVIFRKLKKDISVSKEFENQIIHNPTLSQQRSIRKALDNQYDLILEDLDRLSEIQLFEGKRLLETSNQIIASNGITNRLEVALLIVILLIFLMAVSSPKALIQKDLWYN
ncbi:hypothetical protein [Ekhidna sp.]|uniref:hypothetical protein n=1 Tax=Ekhidna sp. TaxID=2608089 RepID=UPI0035117FA2